MTVRSVVEWVLAAVSVVALAVCFVAVVAFAVGMLKALSGG